MRYFFEAISSSKAYSFNVRVNYNPMDSLRMARLIHIGNLQTAITPSELDQEMRSVGMRNDDIEFNCQNWVMDALKKLAEDGWLTNAQLAEGANEMIETILDAEDDEK